MIPSLMFQGTGSDVGKSVLTAGLCRAYTRRGLKVRPFKPQNMSNNAAVTNDGGEIGRAQALQARACNTQPHTDMNPVLLKPQTETGAQVIVNGKIVGNANAREYQNMKPSLMGAVKDGFYRLSALADLVLVEGAGSAAEVNLRAADIANMGFAEAVNIPVMLIGDIDRGGVIAQLVGTWNLLSESERGLTRGFIVNKFRGDASLFDDGLEIIREQTAMASYGVVPWFSDASRLPREDAFDTGAKVEQPRAIKIVVPVLSRIANFDDLDPLCAEPEVSVVMVRAGEALPGDADLVVLPGSKATLADLEFVRTQGWDIDISAHLRRGGAVLGICGGYQMLGTAVSDPAGIEGPPAEALGLGLLDIRTVLTAKKTLNEVSGTDTMTDTPISGYEMHVGETDGPDTAHPMLKLRSGADGAISADGRVFGCYVHGIFGSDAFRSAFLQRLKPGVRATINYEASIDETLDALAHHLEIHLDLDGMVDA
ncbi:MAG: cobyric acid synthase [Pseudomonadota bacterium]|nr:cobyric acid synthase [Pseudomonadota bacterium]